MPKKPKKFPVRLTLKEMRYCLVALRMAKERETFIDTRSMLNKILTANDVHSECDFLIPERNDLKIRLSEYHDY